jgi:chromosome segregation ATPase
MFSSWAEAGLSNALMAVGQIVAPFEGDIEPGQEGVDWEEEVGDGGDPDGSSGNIDIDSFLSAPSPDDEPEIKSSLSASEDSFDGAQYLAERMAFDSPGGARGEFGDHSRVLDSEHGNNDENAEAMDMAGPFGSPAASRRGDGDFADGIDVSPIAPTAPESDQADLASSRELEQLREKSFYLERTITHLVEDQELLEKKLTEKNRTIMQLQAFETLAAQLQGEVRALREKNEKMAAAISEHRALTSVFASPGARATADDDDADAAASAAAAAAEEAQDAKMSELIFALQEYEQRVQGLQLEVKMLRQGQEKEGEKSRQADEAAARAAAAERDSQALAARLAAAEASVTRLEAEVRVTAAALAQANEQLQLAQARQMQASPTQQQQHSVGSDGAALERELVLLRERFKEQGVELEASLDQGVQLSQDWSEVSSQLQELRRSNSELVAECEQLRARAQQASVQVPEEEARLAEEQASLRQQVQVLRRELQARSDEAEQLRVQAGSSVDLSEKLAACQAANSRFATEAAGRDAEAADLRVQAQAMKTKAGGLEEEKKQLNVIISQLRSTRRVNKDENDSVLAERNHFREQCEQLQAELLALRGQQQAQAAEAAYIAELEGSLQSSRDAQEQLLRASTELQDRFDGLEKQHHDGQLALEALASDHIIAKQDLENRERELGNMMSIIANVEGDSKAAVARLVKEHEARLEALRESASAALRESDARHEALQLADRAALKELRGQVEHEQALRRKLEVETRREKKRMEASVETALKQLKNTDMEGVVDRTLIANLITTYVQQRR